MPKTLDPLLAERPPASLADSGHDKETAIGDIDFAAPLAEMPPRASTISPPW